MVKLVNYKLTRVQLYRAILLDKIAVSKAFVIII